MKRTCPHGCGLLVVRDSKRDGCFQIQYLRCPKCGWTPGRGEPVPIEDINRRKPRRAWWSFLIS